MITPIRTWKLTKNKAEELRFEDQSSLDAITRQLPEGWYSTFRTYEDCTRVIGLSDHLKRLPHADASSLCRHLIQFLDPYRPGEARVRVMETKQKQFYISIEPLYQFPRELYEKGARVETTTLRRENPRVKSTAFIGASIAERKHIAQAGMHEALLVKNRRILEGMTSNFFYTLYAEMSEERLLRRAQSKRAQRVELFTALRGILPGVTRTMVIRAAQGRGLGVRYRSLNLDQLPAVSEAFITSSSRGIVPVIQIDEHIIGNGRVGEVTRMLMTAYEDYVNAHAEEIA